MWKSLECELCKSPFPQTVKSGDKRILLRMISYELPVPLDNEVASYIVLESVVQTGSTNKTMHIINMNG